MTRRACNRICRCTALLVLIAGGVVPCLAQDEETPKTAVESLRYMRVEVPNDHPVRWPRFGYKFDPIPMKIEKFQKLLDDAEATRRRNSPSEPRITKIALTARLQDDALIGSGSLEVEHNGTTPAFAALNGCQIAIANAAWEDQESPEAVIGSGPNRQLLLATEKSGRLTFDWSLRGQRDASGVLRLDLSLPDAVARSLTVDVPGDTQVTVSGGVVAQRENMDGDLRRHHIELSGSNPIQLLLVPSTVADAPSGPALVRQTNNYVVSDVGFAVTSQMELQVLENAFTQPSINVRVDEGLQPVNVTLNGESVPWSSNESGSQLQVRLTQPLSPQTKHQLTIEGVGSLTLGEATTLPIFRPQQLQWLSRRTSIDVATGLVVEQLDVAGGRLELLSGSPTDKSGIHAELMFHEEQGHAVLAVARTKPIAALDQTVGWKIAADGVQGHLEATVTTGEGAIHELIIAVAPHWSLTTQDIRVVAATGNLEPPPRVIAHRLLPATVGASAKSREVRLVLDSPLTPQQALRVEITARHEQFLPAQSVPLSHLMFAAFPELQVGETFAALATAAPLAVELRGEENLQAVAADDLSEAMRAWLAPMSAAIIVKSANNLGDAQLRLVQGSPRLRARVHARAVIRRDGVNQSYRIRCTPDATGLDHLRVSISPPGRGNLNWSFPPEIEQAGVEARRLEVAEDSEGATEQPEVWEINFAVRLTKSFEFTAARSTKTTNGTNIPLGLMSVVDATTQLGRLLVVGDRNLALTVDTTNMQPVSPNAVESEVAKDEVVWAAYRYTPTPAVLPLDAGVILNASDNSTSHAVAWRMLLQSNFGQGSLAIHRATWWIENQGRATMQVTLPAGSTVKSIAVNETQIVHAAGSQTQHIAIGAFGEQAIVAVEFTTEQPQAGIWQELATPQIQTDVPALQRRWQVTPPTGYRLSPTEDRSASSEPDIRPWHGLLSVIRHGASSNMDSPTPSVELPLTSEGASLTVYQGYTFGGCALAIMLSTAGLIFWLRRLRLRWLLTVCFLAAGTTLLLSNPWSLLASGAFAGSLVGIALAIAVRGRRPRRQERMERGSTPLATAGLLLLTLLTGTVATQAIAQEAKSPTVYPLWFPVDGDGKPTGYVHLPRPFAAALAAQAKAHAEPKRDWLIDRADYHLHFERNANDERLDVRELEIDLAILVLADVTEVQIPLPREDAALLDDGSLLNDEPVEIAWGLRQPGLRIPVAGRGLHRLLLRVRPTTAIASNAASINFAIPPIPQAHLTITLPNDATEVTIDQCFGAITNEAVEDTEEVTLEAAIGAVDRLSVTWLPQRNAAPPTAVFELDKLVWLKFDQDSPTIEATFRGSISEGELTHLNIQADGDLTLLRGDAKLLASSETSLKTYRTAVVRNGHAFEASLTFQLPSVPIAGRFALPMLVVPGAREKSCHVAVNAPASANIAPALGLELAKNDVFLSRWGATTQTPDRAFTCDLNAAALLLALTPQQPLPTAQETLTFAFSPAKLAIKYDAVIAASPLHCHVANLPAGMSVHSVSAMPSTVDQSRPSDIVAWWAVRDDRLEVFFRNVPTVPFQLSISGEVPPPNFGRVKLPTIQLTTANVTSSRLEIRRQSDLLVELTSHKGFTLIEADDDVEPNADAWPVASLQAILGKAAIKNRSCLMQTRRNRPVATGRQITQLVRRDTAWDVLIDVDVRVVQGQLDQLQWEIPTTLADAISVPGHRFRITPTLDESRQLLTITPAAAIDDAFDVRIVARNIIPLGQDVSLPDILPLSEVNYQRYAAVPATFESRNIAWETDGLQPLSTEVLRDQLDPSAGDVRLFQVVADPHRATLRSFTEVTGVPLVALADVHFAWDAAGACAGRALLDLEPAGLTDCIVEVPEHLQLSQVRIDDLPAQVHELSPQRWRVKLSSTKLPQRVEVLYSGTIDVAGRGSSVHAVAPALSEIAVQRTLWTIYAPSSIGEALATGGGISGSRLDLLRLRSLADVIRLPRHLRLEYSSTEIQDWLCPWQARYQRQRGATTAAASALQDADFNFRQSLQELEVPEALTTDVSELPSAADTAWNTLTEGRPVAARRMVKGASRQLQFDFAPAPTLPTAWPRYLSAMGFLVAALLTFTAPRWLPGGDWPLRFGPAIAVAVGLLLATLVWPPEILWLVVLGGIGLYFLLRRPEANDPLRAAIVVRTVPQDDSTI